MGSATAVLVHGAWHDRSCWGAVAAGLEVAGIEVIAIDLGLRTVGEDALLVRAAVAAAEGPVVLVGHSYGGMAITAGGHGAGRLLYVAAFAPDEGDAVAAMAVGTQSDLEANLVVDDGDIRLAPGAAAALYALSPEELAEDAMERWRPTAIACLTGVLTGPPAWTSVPGSYVACLDDRAVDPDLQVRMARHAGLELIRVDSDHSPFFCIPDALADLVAEEVGRL